MAMVPQLHNQRHFQDFRSRNNDLNSLGKSPIKVDFLLTCLEQYPMKEDAKLLADGFTNGFRLQYNGPRHFRDCQNLLSVKQNPTAATQKVMREV